jgi:hypothetical protein
MTKTPYGFTHVVDAVEVADVGRREHGSDPVVAGPMIALLARVERLSITRSSSDVVGLVGAEEMANPMVPGGTSPASSELALSTQADPPLGEGQVLAMPDLNIMNADGTNQTRLTFTNYNSLPDWQPCPDR